MLSFERFKCVAHTIGWVLSCMHLNDFLIVYVNEIFSISIPDCLQTKESTSWKLAFTDQAGGSSFEQFVPSCPD